MSVFLGWIRRRPSRYDERMIDSFVSAYAIYFVVIDAIGDAPIFLSVPEAQDPAQLRAALGAPPSSPPSCCSSRCAGIYLAYLNNSEAAFKIASRIILFLVALDMLAAKRQQPKRGDQLRQSCHLSAGHPTFGWAIGHLSAIVVSAVFLPACSQTR